MPITFNCPQGHRLTCADELAGKPGKCPKCGMVVRVPSPAVVTAAPANGAPAADDEPASALESAADGATPSSLGVDQIIFLCPNGHRLHGAASLAGQPGQCPHCGVKFLVPSPDEEEEEAVVEPEDEALGAIVIQIDTSSKSGSSKSGRASSKSGSSLPASAHPLANVLLQMWRYKAQGASIEVHLGDGKLIVPDEFSPKDALHAFFATKERDGSVSVTVVGWSSIERIVLRGLEQPPREWF